MRSRNELYGILVDELRIDNAKATEILDNAFALYDDETKKRDKKIEELKEKFVGKLLYIDSDSDSDSDDSLPACIFVNDIKETYSLDYFKFVGPHIILDENEFHFYSIEDTPLTVGMDELDKIEVVNDMGHLGLSKEQFIKQFLYYKLLGKRVETCMNKFIDECEID